MRIFKRKLKGEDMAKNAPDQPTPVKTDWQKLVDQSQTTQAGAASVTGLSHRRTELQAEHRQHVNAANKVLGALRHNKLELDKAIDEQINNLQDLSTLITSQTRG